MDRPTISPTQESALIQVIVLFLLVTGVLAVLSRTIMKYVSARKLGIDDGLIFGSLLLYAAQSGVIYVAATNGLGTSDPAPTADQISNQLKAEYAASFLSISSMALAKLSYLCFCYALSPAKLEKWTCIGLFASVGAWWLTSILTGAFQCSMPHPWDYLHGTCFSRQGWWTYVTVVNILTEIFLIALPFRIVWQAQISNTRKKVPALIVFSSRSLIIISAVVQLVYYLKALSSDNIVFSIWQPVFIGQFVQCSTIVTTSFLYIKLLIDGLESGFLRVDDIRRRTYGSRYGSNKVPSSAQSISRRHNSQPLSPISSRPRSQFLAGGRSRPISTVTNGAMASGPTSPQTPRSPRWPLSTEALDLPEWEAKAPEHGIVETKTFTVENSPS